MTDPILERYIQIIRENKTGDVTPDGESILKIYNDGTKVWRNKQGQYHRRDGPAIEFDNGDKAWYINGDRHREDGPAVEYDSGVRYWYINDKRHREDGPAIEWVSGDKWWYINGEELSEDEFYAYIVNKAIKGKKK